MIDQYKKNGFALLELLISIGIGAIVLIVLVLFAINTLKYNASAQAGLTSSLEGRKILSSVTSEFRSMSSSVLGSYAIETAGTSTITFYSDVNGDERADRVRYFFDAPTRSVKRGVVIAAGSPPGYNLGSETISTLVTDVSNGTSTPLFDYYDKNYAGTSSPLMIPVPIQSVRLIKITVKIEKDINRSPEVTTIVGEATLRNLKDNL